MNSTLSVGITLLLASVSGIAVWGRDSAAGAAGTATAPATMAAPWRMPAEAELALDLLRLLDETQRKCAVLADHATPVVMLRASVPPVALSAQRGLPWSAMSEGQRAVCWWLLRRFATAACGDAAATELAGVEGAVLQDLSFAWAGTKGIGDEAAYCRLHGSHFVVEDHRPAGGGAARVVWRDFARDAAVPWLADQVRAAAGK